MENNKLPLLGKALEMLGDLSLKNTYIVGGQHILGTTLAMFQQLSKKGLSLNKVYLIGKCYSTSQKIYEDMKNDRLHVSCGSKTFIPSSSFDEYYPKIIEKFVDEFLDAAKLTPNSKIILLDDGGFLINEFINRRLHANHQVSAVEQTTSGYAKLKLIHLPFSVINVARSNAKLSYESPVIARVAHNILTEKLHRYKLVPKNALIIGNGAIGSAMHDELIGHLKVDCYDTIDCKSDLITDKLQDLIGKYDLIIGCTGTTSLPKKLHSYLKANTILVSISSSDREFDAKYLRPKSTTQNECHKDIFHNQIHLINNGFPINFYGGTDSVPPQYIQLTRALLMLAIGQAAQQPKEKKGFFSLKKQKEITKEHCDFHKKSNAKIATG